MILEVGLDLTRRRRDESDLAERNAEVARLADHLRALAVDLSQAEQRERRLIRYTEDAHLKFDRHEKTAPFTLIFSPEFWPIQNSRNTREWCGHIGNEPGADQG